MKGLVCWFDEQGLHGNKRSKAKAFNRNKLIIPLGLGLFEILPLKGNKTTHIVFYDGKNNSCTCQAYKCKGEYCSHLFAVGYFEHIKGGISE